MLYIAHVRFRSKISRVLCTSAASEVLYTQHKITGVQ